jgi:anti-sigma factor RsiW
MTSENPPSPPRPDDLAGHLDHDILADLDAGLLEPPVAARAGRHVESCSRCSATLAAFAAVQADLRSLPPPPLPEAVAARLDDTLARLRAGPDAARLSPNLATHPGQPDAHGSGGPATPPTPADASAGASRGAPVIDLAAAAEQRRARARKLTGRVAASVVVAAALVGVGTAVMQHTDDGGTIAQGNALPREQTRSNGGRGAGGASDHGPTVDSGPLTKLPAYTGETLLGAIPTITVRSAVDIVTGAGQDGPAGPMADIVRRASCTAGIPGVNGIPIAVQRVLFDNQSAYVFVLAGTDGSRTVVVVSADCGVAAVPQVLFRHQD